MDIGRFMERTEKTGILGVKVSQGGRDIWKHLWDDECRRNVYSASKSFTSAAGGAFVPGGEAGGRFCGGPA